MPFSLHAEDSQLQKNKTLKKPHNIIIVYKKSQGFSQQLIENLLQHMRANGNHISQILLTSNNQAAKIESLKNQHQKLLIAIGSEVTKTLLDAKIELPILSALIPRHIYKSLKLSHKNKLNWSSLIINQPIDRQLHLITAVLGKNKNTAVILGPYTKDLNQPLNKASLKTKQRINIQQIETSDQIPETLDSLNNSIDVLLTLPDPIVYNKNTLRGILLLSYRNKLPLIGFSQSYVKAGAIAAIYSKPEQISRQITEIVKHFFINQSFNKSQYYPDDFSVALNKNIARSLGIKLASNRTIINRIKKAEKNQ